MKKKYRSKKAYEEARRRRRRLLWLILIIPVITIITISIVTRLERFHIEEVIVQGADLVNQDQIEKAVSLQLDDAQLFIISNQTSATFPKSETEESILASNPALDTVDINIDDKVVTVSVQEKAPFAAVCRKQESDLSTCYVVDDEGVVFSLYTEDLQQKNKVPIVVKDKSEYFKLDEKIADDEIFSFVKDFITLSNQENVNTFNYLMISIDGTVDAYYLDNSYIRFLSNRPLADQVEALETTFARMNTIAATLEGYEYVDVRFEDRVYLKKTESTQEESNSTVVEEDESTVQSEE